MARKKTGIEKIKHPRFGIKMATGTGKTWVITAIIVWQYWNKTKYQTIYIYTYFYLKLL